MANLIEHPQQAQGEKRNQHRKRVLVPSNKRFKRRILPVLRHPVDALWGWLSSVRTAIFLIAAITCVFLIGIYFVQAPMEVIGDPAAYPAWVQQNALPRYGSLTPLYDWLQFFTVFSSWYCKLLLTILSLSIVVCTLNRAPAIWHNVTRPLLRRSEQFYQNALERSEFSHADAVDWTRTALRKRHYRARSVVETGEQSDGSTCEVTYLYANKNSWATLSTFVFHAALVMLLMAGVVSQWRGFNLNSAGRRFLPAPVVNLANSLAGFSFDQALPNGQSAVVYPRGTPHNISFRVNAFTATFDRKTGLPTDYVTDLSVFSDGELVARSNHLRVNDPLTYGGVGFHQSSLIPSVDITITDKQGFVLYNGSTVLDQSTNATQGVMVDFARNIPIPDSNLTLSVFFIHDARLQLAQVPNPTMLITVGRPGSSMKQDKVVLRLKPGGSGQSIDKEWTIRSNSASEASVLLVTKDAGALFVWPIAIILILSLCVTFYFPQRRIWIRIEGERVQMAALREHFTNIRTDLLGVARAASRVRGGNSE
jgi:cytochrome c biogenesis protein